MTPALLVFGTALLVILALLARPIRRALQKYVEDPLSEALIQGQLAGATQVEVFLSGQELDFRPIGIETADDALLIH